MERTEETVLIIGAARSGVAVAQTLVDHGKKVILTDTREERIITKEFPQVKQALAALPEDRAEKVLGVQIPKERINDIDFIVTSPGVPLTVPIIDEAFHCGVPVIGEVELAYSMTKTPFVAITGTNGKTTTTTLTGEIFKNSGRKTFTVGNIGDPISKHVDAAGADDVFVTEISSFQLQTCNKFHPVAAAVLNLSPDHLDRHKTLENYYSAKARVFENQCAADFVVLNADDEAVCAIGQNAKSRKLYFSITQEVEAGAFLKDDVIVIRDGKDIPLCRVDELGLKGPHNVMNVLAAVVLTYFSGVDTQAILKTIKEFKGVEHRQERFVTMDGVEYINDSKGTNTNATITALTAMTHPTILLAGGYDKNEDYSDLMDVVVEKVKTLILLGATANNMEKAAREKGYDAIVRVANYEEGVQKACQLATSGDVVMLSPACASWDMFDNYEDRGCLFKELVQKYGRK